MEWGIKAFSFLLGPGNRNIGLYDVILSVESYPCSSHGFNDRIAVLIIVVIDYYIDDSYIELLTSHYETRK